MSVASAYCIAWAMLFAEGASLGREKAADRGVQLAEVSPHQLSNFRSSPTAAAEQVMTSQPSSRLLRRESFSQLEHRQGRASAPDIVWGDYRMHFMDNLWDCKESETCPEDSWVNCSFIGLWKGSQGSLSVASSHIMNKGQLIQGGKALLLYKAACSVTTTRRIGVTMDMPLTTDIIEMVFGITQHCTGLCAPLTVAVLDKATSVTHHRWCFNHEGNETEVECHNDLVVPNNQWNRVALNISEWQDYTTQLTLEIAVYTNGDFRFYPALLGEVGIGGRALAIIDTLVFRPSANPSPSGHYDDAADACSESQQDVCGVNAWCWEKYRCKSEQCIEGGGRCNYIRNCPDDSDEVGCEYPQGMLGRFYFTHGLHIAAASSVHVSLSNPDLTRLKEQVEYDVVDWRTIFGVTDYFAAEWEGNLTIRNEGNYYFSFNNSGIAHLSLAGIGLLAGQDHNDITSGDYVHLSSGKWQVFLKFVHTTGDASIEFKWRGPQTFGAWEIVPTSSTRATMTGSRCDLLACGDGLSGKVNKSEILCAGVPCVPTVDTAACCQQQYLKVSAGKYHTCALTIGGNPICWGAWRDRLQEWKNHVGPFIDIDTFDKYTCGVHQTLLTVECWQKDSEITTDIDFSAAPQFQHLSIGGDHVCGLRDTGYIACTGENSEDQANPPADFMFYQVTSGEEFACGIQFREDRPVRCWGINEHGQTGDVPMNDTGFTHISAGTKHMCGVHGGEISCWGLNDHGQATPPSGSEFQAVGAGGQHTCALKNDGTVACWGSNTHGQCSPTPEDMPLSQISAGEMHTCGIRAADQQVVCWGYNFEPGANGAVHWRGQSLPPPASSTWPPGGPPDYTEEVAQER